MLIRDRISTWLRMWRFYPHRSTAAQYSVRDGKLVCAHKGETDYVEQQLTLSRRKGAMRGPSYVIMHYTAGESVSAAKRVFLHANVSAHIIVGRQGQVLQMVEFGDVAWHAGKSQLPRTHKDSPLRRLNNYAIGIELVNYGYDGDHVPASVDTSLWKKLRHHAGAVRRLWQPYTPEQLEAAEGIVLGLCKHYAIPAVNVLGHEEISPKRKVDPGPAFGMAAFRKRIKKGLLLQ